MHFVDSNILVYGCDDSDPAKRDRAQLVMRRLWESRSGRLSHQVLQEFYVTVTRKLKPALPRSLARAEVEDLLDWKPLRPSPALLKQAWLLEDQHGLYGLRIWGGVDWSVGIARAEETTDED